MEAADGMLGVGDRRGGGLIITTAEATPTNDDKGQKEEDAVVKVLDDDEEGYNFTMGSSLISPDDTVTNEGHTIATSTTCASSSPSPSPGISSQTGWWNDGHKDKN